MKLVDRCPICKKRFDDIVDHAPCAPLIEELGKLYGDFRERFPDDDDALYCEEDEAPEAISSLNRWKKKRKKTLGTALFIDHIED